MCSAKNTCPVPFDQQPLNEFYSLQQSGLFFIFGLKAQSYFYSLLNISLLLIFISVPFFASFFFYHWVQFLTVELLFTTFMVSLILVRLYLGWSYIIDRLFSAVIFYEESGWYDGQIWIKTPDMLTKDRLIGTYYVLPVLRRIQFTFVFLLLAIFIESLSYYLLC